MFCTACGTENPAGSRYCANCGAVLAESLPDTTSVIGSHVTVPESDGEFSTEAHQGAIDALAPGSALLVVKRGPNAGSRFLLDQDAITAGRHPDSDIFLDDVTVSRRHAEFHRDGSTFTVRACPLTLNAMLAMATKGIRKRATGIKAGQRVQAGEESGTGRADARPEHDKLGC